MALPTGQISMSQVNTELGRSSTAAISMNDSGVRGLFGKGSGAISMNDGRGKSASFGLVIAANMSNVDLRTLAINNGWNQSSALNVTINSGVVISSTSTATPALTVSGSFPGGVSLVNNGSIVGKGGNGAGGYGWMNSSCGGAENLLTKATSGGTALSVSAAVSFTNNGTIGGGGGGGGAGGIAEANAPINACAPVPGFGWQSGGAGGGGAGSGSGGSYQRFCITQAEGSTFTSCVASGAKNAGYVGAAGGVTTGGAAGAKAPSATWPCGTITAAGNGGAGGGLGSAGTAGTNGANPSGGMLTRNYGSSAGAAGSAVSGNSYITWVATGTRLGAIA